MAINKTQSLSIADAYRLGVTLHRQGKLGQAENLCRQIVEAKPDHADALHLLGVISTQRDRLPEAVEQLNVVLAMAPDHADAHGSLANVLQMLDRPGEAIESYRRALALAPDNADIHYNLGSTLQAWTRHEEAIASFRQAIAIRPDFAEAHHNHAHSLLAMGDFAAGWAEYEWRWRVPDLPTHKPGFTVPQWDGGPLGERTILLHAEQGIGDAIQFCRYVPLIARAHPKARIVLALYGRLIDIARASFGDAIEFLPYRDLAEGQLPPFDVQAPLMSLPRILGTTPHTVPSETPYLRPVAPSPRPTDDRLVVGLSWYTNNARTGARRRIPLTDFSPLGAVPDVHFVSLQYGDTAVERRAAVDVGLVVEAEAGLDFMTDLTAFAGCVAACDLVISIDNSTVHMAGALGRPVWTLLPAAADWRWMLDRDDTPWYPTMRLFRQSRAGDWGDVIHRVRDALAGAAALHVETRRARPHDSTI
ncbi:MAG: tetratricopeptide repeat protein [Alphaproteobacteria bacterium]|nr:tetratricopeptide repeat protein [Alphaproteobacteria bacterium]